MEIANALIRLAALYQIAGFATVNAFVLSDWILDNLKHKPMGIILEALKNPPVLYENGEVLRNWRLNPDTVYAWVDKKSIEAESLHQVEQTRQYHDNLRAENDLSPTGKEMVNFYLKQLQEGMFKKQPRKSDPKLSNIDLLLKLIGLYKKENIDPITGKLKENALDEREWLLEKGYYIENGQIKELESPT